MPKSRSFRVVVAASPEVVRARLREATVLRLFPSTARFLALSKRPLAGRVAGDGGFNVAVNAADLWTRLLPTARGTVSEGSEGTVVEGVAGLPTWLTWYLRAVFVIVAIGTVAAGGAFAAGNAELGPPFVAGLVGLVLAILAIGVHVSNADANVERLVTAVERAATGGEAPPVAEAEAVDAEAATTAPRPRGTERV
ncbi:MAG: hypothetical protein ACOZNI_25650 [Myxococcota bacterium]